MDDKFSSVLLCMFSFVFLRLFSDSTVLWRRGTTRLRKRLHLWLSTLSFRAAVSWPCRRLIFPAPYKIPESELRGGARARVCVTPTSAGHSWEARHTARRYREAAAAWENSSKRQLWLMVLWIPWQTEERTRRFAGDTPHRRHDRPSSCNNPEELSRKH